MSEISKPFPSAPATSPSRDPRRSSRQENPANVSSVPNPVPALMPSKPKSYGEKLIESLAGLSTEASTTTALKNEYSRAKKAQLGLNQQYDKLKNLGQFPAAKDLVSRIRDAQTKDIDSLKDQLTARKEAQKALSKHAAALVDAEAKGQNHPSDALRSIEAETKSNKLSVQSVREDFTRLTKETTLANERYTDIQKTSKSHSDELGSLKRAQDENFKLLRRTCDRVDALSDQLRKQTDEQNLSADHKRLSRLDDDVYELKRSLNDRVEAKVEQYLRQRRDPPKLPTGPNQNSLKTLEDRIVDLEKRPLQSSSPTPEYDTLTKRVSDIFSRLKDVETSHQHLTTVVDGVRSIHAMKDDLLTQLIDENHKKIQQQLEETVVKVKAEAASDLEKAMVQVKTEGVKSETGSMASLRESVEIQDQRLQTVETAVGSLETRYSSFTPDSLSLQLLPIVQRHYPPAQALYTIVERFHNTQVQLAQVAHIPGLSAAVENQSRQLAVLASHISRGNEGSNEERKFSAAVIEIQARFSQLQQRINEFEKTLTDRVDDLQAQSRNQDIVAVGSGGNEPQPVKQGLAANHENDLQSQPQGQSTAVTQSTEINAQSVEEKLTDLINEVENKVQSLEQKISDVLGENGLKDTTLNLENLEVALQQHVESLTQQIAQLEDKQETTASVVKFMSARQNASYESNASTLTTVEDLVKSVDALKDQQSANDFQTKIEGIMGEVKELAYRLQEIEQAKAILERRFRGSQSPRPERTPSPVLTNRSELSRRDEEVQSNPSDMNSISSNSQKKEKKKRKLSKAFSSSPQPSLFNSPSSTPLSTPGPDGSSKPP